MSSTQGAFAQAGEGITFCKHGSLGVGGLRHMKQVALFGGEEKEQAVDQPEELLEIALG